MQNDSEKQFIKLMNYKVGKSVGNMRRHRDIKLVKTEARRNYLLSEPKYHTKKIRKISSHRNEKSKNIHESICLFRSINATNK